MTPIKTLSTGPAFARIMVVGDFPDTHAEYHRTPFGGRVSDELSSLLHEAGFLRSEVYATNVCPYRPINSNPDTFVHPRKTNPPAGFSFFLGKYVHPLVKEGVRELLSDIERIQPSLIICLGDLALWAVSGGEKTSVSTWRGSQLTTDRGVKYLPTYHPATILRQWSYRTITISDLKRAQKWLAGEAEPRDWKFLVRPSFFSAMQTIQALLDQASTGPLLLSVDLETRAGHLACCGIAWSDHQAISIPFMCVENPDGYWDLDEETAIILALRRLFTHPSVSIVGQNFSYDAQYIHRYWHFTPNVRHDTMLAQGLLWPGLPKALDFLASVYCRHYIYWKDDGKTWDPKIPEEQLWTYNCEDACRTFEVLQEQLSAISTLNLSHQYYLLMRRWFPVQQMMRRGVAINKPARGQMAMELMSAMSEREAWFAQVLGHPLNPRSSKQMQQLFYDDLRVPVQRNRKSGNASLDDKALTKIKNRQPLLAPLVKTITDFRSLGVFLSTFVQAPLDVDGRMRCSYNIVGTETFRFNSSENAFGSGTNLQNIPKGNEAPKPGDLAFPNIRRLFPPDPGYLICDADLDRADLQVVVWESSDDELKAMLRAGVDLHFENAKTLGVSRPLAKAWVHGCVTAGHEYLTPSGWVDVADHVDGIPIAVWDAGHITFEIPRSFNRDHAISLVTLEGESWSQEMTWDHRVVYKDGDCYRVSIANEIPQSARLPKSGMYSGQKTVDEAALIAAYQADGSIDSRGRLRFRFKKQRKVERLLKLFPSAKVYSNADGSKTIDCKGHNLHTGMKYPGPWMLDWSGESLDVWLDELKFWDGYRGPSNRIEITSVKPEVREWVSTIAHLRGKASAWFDRISGFGSRSYGTSINNRPFARVSSMSVTKQLTAPTPVYCPQTSTGFWVFRRKGKIGITGNTNYGGGPRTMAANCGITVHQAELMQKRWFSAHPGIKAWHDRTLSQLQTTRSVYNPFGFRRFYFDRIEGILPEALAWIPQSTVAHVIDEALFNIALNLPEVQILLQVHDSLVFQIPRNRLDLLPRIREQCQILIPYPDPLIIPVGLSISSESWGSVRPCNWSGEFK